ncbi:MAG TPA: response regulator transcription factor [Lachnospiraceae bacterium]
MIFCVEDEESIRELMLYTLRVSGFDAEGFSSGEAMLQRIKEKIPSLILLDIMLPGQDGISILKKLRTMQELDRVPIIMATAKGSEYDKVLGLDLGADDYLTKPFGMMEMISRIKARLRRIENVEEKQELVYKELTINLKERKVLLQGQEIELTRKEYDLLCFLINHRKTVYSREDLLLYVWGEEYMGETRTVDVHIGTLRNKLGNYGKQIQTIRGIGYRLEDVK